MTHDPFARFRTWFDEAVASEPRVPDAMQLATLSPEGRPRIRTVLLKDHGPDGFVFYTNLRSRKGADLTAHPVASLLFHWKTRERQVIVEGAVAPVSDAEADAYFASRPRGSQLGAWASEQSAPLDDHATLLARVAALEAEHAGAAVPRPPHWSGFRLEPVAIEFWQGQPSRLHVRDLYTREADGTWSHGLLQP